MSRARLSDVDTRCVTPGSSEWPTHLAPELVDLAPNGLWVCGNTALDSLLRSRTVAVTGSRTSTAYGDTVAAELGHGLVDCTVVNSGGFGIDASVLRGALAVGRPTIVVQPGGFTYLHPSAHPKLFEAVVAGGGLIVSPFEPDTVPTMAGMINARELVATLARATVVVEGGSQVNTRVAADRALALGRPLMAVPGPVTSATSYLPNRLIRNGDAVLVTNADEVLETLVDRETAFSVPNEGTSHN